MFVDNVGGNVGRPIQNRKCGFDIRPRSSFPHRPQSPSMASSFGDERDEHLIDRHVVLFSRRLRLIVNVVGHLHDIMSRDPRPPDPLNPQKNLTLAERCHVAGEPAQRPPEELGRACAITSDEARDEACRDEVVYAAIDKRR